MTEDKFKDAVKHENGDPKNFTIKLKGKPFRCDCKCNVFHKPNKENLNQYKCNSCGTVYEAE